MNTPAMLTAMGNHRRLLAALGVASILAFSGCAGTAGSPSTPTPTSPSNAEACEAFWDATVDLAQALTGSENAKDATEGLEAKFDDAYLSASGEVADRIKTTMANFPKSGLHMLYLDNDQFMTDMKAVVRACRHEGIALPDAPAD